MHRTLVLQWSANGPHNLFYFRVSLTKLIVMFLERRRVICRGHALSAMAPRLRIRRLCLGHANCRRRGLIVESSRLRKQLWPSAPLRLDAYWRHATLEPKAGGLGV